MMYMIQELQRLNQYYLHLIVVFCPLLPVCLVEAQSYQQTAMCALSSTYCSLTDSLLCSQFPNNIICNGNNQIVELTINGRCNLNLYNSCIGLTQTIPTQLATLTSLISLNLQSYVFTGSIPRQLAALTHLTYLNLNGNRLTGPIPIEMGLLTGLVELDLGNQYGNIFNSQNSGLVRSIPTQLGALTNLQSLYLNDNTLGGTIPTELALITTLNTLHLQGNVLTGFVPSLFLSLTDFQYDQSVATYTPSMGLSVAPSFTPTAMPSLVQSSGPTAQSSTTPSLEPSETSTSTPSCSPSQPSIVPSMMLSAQPVQLSITSTGDALDATNTIITAVVVPLVAAFLLIGVWFLLCRHSSNDPSKPGLPPGSVPGPDAVVPTAPYKGEEAARINEIDALLPGSQDATADRVFLSLRFGEAWEAAVLLQECLARRGVSAYLASINPGQDISALVLEALERCTLFVVLGTETYGFHPKEGAGVLISTRKELEYAITNRKPLFLIKMCDEFKEPIARLHLHGGIAYKEWNPPVGDPPERLIDAIIKRLERFTVEGSGGGAEHYATV